MSSVDALNARHGVSVDIVSAYKVFDASVEALAGVSLSVPAGQFISLLGPSGCGKSTLLRSVAGLEELTSGSIAISGKMLGRHESRAGAAFVFQDAHLLPWRTVLRNVELPLEFLGVGNGHRRARAVAAIEEVGLGDAIRRYPMQLSGGMRMRVSLARALVTRPKLLLLDEPFAALDEFTRYRLDEQLYSLWRKSGMTVFFVTHSISEAVFLSQRAIMLSRRPGRVLADIPVNLGAERNEELRSDTTFAGIARQLQHALRGQEDE